MVNSLTLSEASLLDSIESLQSKGIKPPYNVDLVRKETEQRFFKLGNLSSTTSGILDYGVLGSLQRKGFLNLGVSKGKGLLIYPLTCPPPSIPLDLAKKNYSPETLPGDAYILYGFHQSYSNKLGLDPEECRKRNYQGE
jgi:hypothetical protein